MLSTHVSYRGGKLSAYRLPIGFGSVVRWSTCCRMYPESCSLVRVPPRSTKPFIHFGLVERNQTCLRGIKYWLSINGPPKVTALITETQQPPRYHVEVEYMAHSGVIDQCRSLPFGIDYIIRWKGELCKIHSWLLKAIEHAIVKEGAYVTAAGVSS